MAIFNKRFYVIGKGRFVDLQGYEEMLNGELERCANVSDKHEILKGELVEITKHITEGIRDLINHERHVKKLVTSGIVPLATWTDFLNKMAKESVDKLKSKLDEMKFELEHGKVQGLPGTMLMYGKPSFTDFEGFYNLIFEKL